MINYVEKGAGLHEAISKAGHSLREENGVLISSDDIAVQAIIDGYSIDQAQARIAAQVNALAEEKFNAAVKGTSPAEMAGWPILRAEQARYEVSGLETDCPSIAFEAQVRGVTVADMINRVKANVVQFDALRALIAGVSGKHRDIIKNLPTFAEIEGYDYTTGWPL